MANAIEMGERPDLSGFREFSIEEIGVIQGILLGRERFSGTREELRELMETLQQERRRGAALQHGDGRRGAAALPAVHGTEKIKKQSIENHSEEYADMATEKKLTVRELLEQAKAKGSISGKELVAYIDENELELDTIEKLYENLETSGVKIEDDYEDINLADLETLEIEEHEEPKSTPVLTSRGPCHRRPRADVSQGNRQGAAFDVGAGD